MRNKRLICLVLSVAVLFGCYASDTPMGNLRTLPPFERAVVIIKYYETLHRPKDWPYIGYGHQLQPGEPYRKGVQLNAKQADALLRQDLLKFCAMFRQYGADSLLLGVLSYNIGPYRLLGTSKTKKSAILTALDRGDRIDFAAYMQYCHYNGRRHPGILRHRYMEYTLLCEK